MEIKGNVIFDPSVDYSQVTSIGGSIYCSGADTKASFHAYKAFFDDKGE